ncbi:Polysaccharide deacetylase [Olavius sp. associated proteobacterium Delta 1]|nr:Polysaccharide deacetylase [Olavius sp. associated proteobacterium Delta 1]
MIDFTHQKYKELLMSVKSNGYDFQTYEKYLNSPNNRTVILKHDIDKNPSNALMMARIEYSLGIKASYYFKVSENVIKSTIIAKIADLRHEIGYHYENMDHCNGNIEKAINDFEINLAKIRRLYPVKTICMHGSPMSRHDNRDLWKKYDYQDFGIIADPYFDIDLSEVFYLTDTGRRWDGDKVIVRDKVTTIDVTSRRSESGRQKKVSEINKTKIGVRKKTMNERLGFKFRNTWDIIEAVKNGLLPDKIMLNIHPQRWTDKPLPWVKELVWQNVKNLVKKYFFVSRKALRVHGDTKG